MSASKQEPASKGSVSRRVASRGSASRKGSASGERAWADPPPPSDTMGYGQRAGGSHPNGMHSCLTNVDAF